MEILFNFGYYLVLFFIPIIIYLQFSKNDWYYVIRYVFAYLAIKKLQTRETKLKRNREEIEQIQGIQSKNFIDVHIIHGTDENGNSFSLKFLIKADLITKVFLTLRITSTNDIYIFPDDGATKITRLSSWQWNTKELQIEILEPFRRLRVIFNGFLRNLTNNHIVEHVQFNFIWSSADAPRFYPSDTNPKLLTRALANEHWVDGSWLEFLGHGQGYQQFGALHGTIRNEKSLRDGIYVNLASSRKRYWDNNNNYSKFVLNRCLDLIIYCKNGLLINICINSIKNGCSQINYGNIVKNDGQSIQIDSIDLNWKNFAPNQNLPQLLALQIKAKQFNYKCILHLNQKQITKTLNDELINTTAECNLNEKQAHGLIELWSKPIRNKVKFIEQPQIEQEIENLEHKSMKLIYYLNDEQVENVKISGGKASSLAFLYALNSIYFDIPPGFIITTKAFRLQLNSNEHLKNTLTLLEDVACKRQTGDLQNICDRVRELFENTEIIPELYMKILKTLQTLESFGNYSNYYHSWAVRSSAIGEDSKELSSAGQNSTFLGCTNNDEIFMAIKLCWASLFSYQSIKYRSQHSIPIYTDMAVIVQKMLPADSAGVLFTCNPLTNNPTEIVITSNFGIGESVVSGKSNVDTFVVKCRYEDKVNLHNSTPSNNQLEIKSADLANKTKLIKLSERTGELQELEILEEETSNNNYLPSLNNEQIKYLSFVSLLIEEKFNNSSSIDIEWAYFNNKLYILQLRPITTLNSWNDTELLHEFDSIRLNKLTIYTTANVAEVFPYAMTSLTQSTVFKILDQASQKRMPNNKINSYRELCSTIFLQSPFLNVLESMHITPATSISSKIIDLAVFGHIVVDDHINSYIIERHGLETGLKQLSSTLRFLKYAWKSEQTLNEMIERVKNLKCQIDENDDVRSAYRKIDQLVRDKMVEITYTHIITSSTAVFYQMIAMNVLVEGAKELTDDHFSDFTLLLSSSPSNNVISAEIPKILEKISKLIRTNEQLNFEFLQTPPELGSEWLKHNQLEAYKLFEEFLNEHGHRSLGELELKCETWSTMPSTIISMIQTNCRTTNIPPTNNNNQTNQTKKEEMSIDDIIRQLKSPKRQLTRWILKFIIQTNRKAISRREQSKSELIKAINQLRIAYKQLSDLMIENGLLIDRNLIFHLTHYEIGQLINERNPLLINKALQRQRLYNTWNKMKFPEISFDLPKPLTTNNRKLSTIYTCKGTPVCSGQVTGRACVITSLDEIEQLIHGDILITYATDIAWSPYFPMLSGIVTELGGLISHGAVIAREYGLPCIVGVIDVIKMFQTGDLITMSGSTGVIDLLSKS